MINIIFSQEYKNHYTGNHPESIERIKVVNNLIMDEYSKHNLIEPTIADKKLISLVHDEEYIDNLNKIMKDFKKYQFQNYNWFQGFLLKLLK